MTPGIYFRILLLTLNCDALVSAFSIVDFLSHPDLLKNVGSQLAGYSFVVFTNRPIEPIKFLPPIISYGFATYDFIT